jgi:hypothetical protein
MRLILTGRYGLLSVPSRGVVQGSAAVLGGGGVRSFCDSGPIGS